MKIILTVSLWLLSFLLFGQTEFKTKKVEVVSFETIDPMSIEDKFSPSYNMIAAPKHYHNEVERAKIESASRFPKKKSFQIQSRSMVEPPEIDWGFDAFVRNTTPPDNTFAIANNGQNISAINRDIRFSDGEGNFLRSFTLSSFGGNTADAFNQFDPRVIYDPESDKFCLVWLGSGSATTADESRIFMAFSSSSATTDPWYVYALDGNPLNAGNWTDYPMISLTNENLILTVNLIKEATPWETGFDQTIIYEIDKESAYQGANELDVNLIYDINFEGKSLRNLHPVKSADEELDSVVYLLSNRNFDVQNDTFFMVSVPEASASNREVEVQALIADVTYGVPPSVDQPGTNQKLNSIDARVLDGFIHNNEIQFVANTIDTVTGKAAIYHGFIEDVGGSNNLAGRIIADPIKEFCFPGIAWTGEELEAKEAIIVAAHSSDQVHLGFSTLYMNDETEYSEWIDVGVGSNVLDSNGLTRWGDYIGCQRQYNKPGVVWVYSCYTRSFNRLQNYVSRLSSPSRNMAYTDDMPQSSATLSVFPNPARESVNVSIDIPRKDNLHIALYDINGQLVKLFSNNYARKIGELQFSFYIDHLPKGSYLLRASLGNNEVLTKKIIKQ